MSLKSVNRNGKQGEKIDDISRKKWLKAKMNSGTADISTHQVTVNGQNQTGTINGL